MNKPMCIFLTQKDKTRLEELSKKRKESKSAIIRKLISIEKYAQTLNQIELNNKINKEFLFQLIRIGANINQIAYHLNIDITFSKEASIKFQEIYNDFLQNIKNYEKQLNKKTIKLEINHIKRVKDE